MAAKLIALGLLLLGCYSIDAQQTKQNPSPMSDSTRPHTRITQQDVPGQRYDLQALKGARLYVASKVDPERAVPLIVHFHGAPWLIEAHVAENLPKAALITVQLGAGSRVYGQPFEDAQLFSSLLDEAAKTLGLKRGWSSITLTGFSAGYGAVRAILRREKHLALVDNVLLLDGIHASYLPDGRPLAEGGVLNPADLDSFVTFSRLAREKRKSFVITHSEIFPGTFVSTTEATDHLITALGMKRAPMLKEGPMGMQQLSFAGVGRLYIFGYAGNSAQDHVDHLHAMPAWFKYLQIK